MMSTMELKNEGSLYVLTLTNGSNGNAISADVIGEYHDILDQLEASTDNGALIVTSNDPKMWCSGVDLKWLITQPPEYFPEYTELIDQLLLRFALLNMPTVGCITGHVYGAGALLATTMDFRFMREDKGFFCFPEVNVGIPFTPFMYELLNLLPDRHAVNELVLTGKRVGGVEALAMKIISAIYPAETLFEKTMEIAAALARKNRQTYTHLKLGLRRHLVNFRKNS